MNICKLNFLRFDHKKWKKFNHNSHFQNRLRHYEYIRLFKSLGFSIISEKVDYGEKNIPKEIEILFKDEDKSWKATSSHIVLKKI